MHAHRWETSVPARDACTGAAWLSSARAVRCWVKSRNERNPCARLKFSEQTATLNVEEGGDDVKSARPLRPGLHTRYNGRADLTSSPPSSTFSVAVCSENFNRAQGLRSLRDLTQHLTARADDSHAAPVHASLAGTLVSQRCACMSSPGKVLRVASN